MYMRKTVEADVARLKKILDDTNITRLHVESDIESLREELITLKKNHEKVSGKLLRVEHFAVLDNFNNKTNPQLFLIVHRIWLNYVPRSSRVECM